MQLTFLGTGAAMVTGERFQTGVVINDGDRRVLVDCGSGVLHRLEQSGIGYESIDTILLTHHHLDHVADLFPLMKARWLAGEGSLEVVGPPATMTLIERLFDAHAYMQDRLELTVREIEPGSHEVGGFTVEAVETIHSLYCLAYRFDDLVVLSGDTEPSEAVVSLADGVPVLVHECAFPDDVEVSNHTRPTELGALLRSVDVGRVYLTHFYPHCSGREGSMRDAVRHEWDGDVRIAEDLLTISVAPVEE